MSVKYYVLFTSLPFSYIHVQVESPSDEEPPSLPHDAPFDVSSSKAYISQLKASLEKSRQYSRLKSPKLQVGKEKKRHMTSPLPLQSSRVTRNARRKLYELRNKDSSDESSENNDMFSSSTTDVEEETNHFKRRHHSMPKATPSSRTHFSPTTKRILNGGRVADTTSTLPNHNTLHSQGASLIHPSATRTDPEVMGSLNAINSQLGELLNRLEHPLPPPAAATYVPPSHTSPSWYGDHENRAAGTTSLKSSRCFLYSVCECVLYEYMYMYVPICFLDKQFSAKNVMNVRIHARMLTHSHTHAH